MSLVGADSDCEAEVVDSGDCESVDAVVSVDDEDDGAVLLSILTVTTSRLCLSIATTARGLTVSLVPIVRLRLSFDSGDCESVDAVVSVDDEARMTVIC